MSKKLQRLADALRDTTNDRRHRTGASRRGLTCDVLEDRQLLSWGGGGGFHGAGMTAFAGGAHGRGGAGMGRSAHVMSHGLRGAGHAAAAQTVSSSSTPAAATAADPSTTSTTASTTTTSSSDAPTTPPADPAGHTLTDAAKTAMETLRTDLHAIQAKSGVTVAQQVAFRDDLQAVAKASTSRASTETQTALQTDLKALNGQLPTDAQATQLKADYTALLKSQGVTDQTLIDKTIADAQAIVTASNVTNDDLTKIAADRKAVQDALGTPAADTTSTSTSTTSDTTGTADTSKTPAPLAGLPFDVILGGERGMGFPGGPMGGFGKAGPGGDGFGQGGRGAGGFGQGGRRMGGRFQGGAPQGGPFGGDTGTGSGTGSTATTQQNAPDFGQGGPGGWGGRF